MLHPSYADLIEVLNSEVEEGEQSDECPALELGGEDHIHHQGGQHNADQQPGLEFTPAAAGILDNIAHDGVIQGIEHTGCHHDGSDSAQLGSGQTLGEENVGEQKVGDQAVHHIPAHSSQRVHDHISVSQPFFIHFVVLPWILWMFPVYHAENGKYSPGLNIFLFTIRPKNSKIKSIHICQGGFP